MKKWIWLLPPLLLLLLLPAIASFIPPIKALFIRAVERKLHAKIEIDRIRFSWLGPQKYEKIRFNTPELEGTIEEFDAKTPFWNLSSHRSFSLRGGACQIYNPPSSVENVQATIHGSHIDLSGQTREGSQTGDFLIQGTPTNFNARGEHMPSLLLDRFLNAQGYLSTALGPEFAFQGNGSEKGSISLQLSSRQANMHLSATFSMKNRQAQGVLDLGRFPLQTSSALNSIFSVLKRRGMPSEILAWVAPIEFRLEQNSLHVERFDFLLDSSIHLCLWGKLDLARNRIDAMLGLPGDTLSRAFNLPSLPPNFILNVPIRGPLNSPNLSTGSATAKIATLLALGTTQSIPKVGPFGRILGFVGANIMSESDEAPPPKKPFPWE